MLALAVALLVGGLLVVAFFTAAVELVIDDVSINHAFRNCLFLASKTNRILRVITENSLWIPFHSGHLKYIFPRKKATRQFEMKYTIKCLARKHYNIEKNRFFVDIYIYVYIYTRLSFARL